MRKFDIICIHIHKHLHKYMFMFVYIIPDTLYYILSRVTVVESEYRRRMPEYKLIFNDTWVISLLHACSF